MTSQDARPQRPPSMQRIIREGVVRPPEGAPTALTGTDS